MRNSLPAFIFALYLFLGSSSVQAQSILGSHHITESERTIGSFEAINVSSGWDLELTQGNAESLTVEADDNLHDVLITEVKGNTLHIYTKRGVQIRGSERKKVHVSFKTLNSISASGGSDVNADDRIETGDIRVQLSGGSDLEFEDLYAGDLTGDFSGGSDATINLSGSGKVEMNCSGGSDVAITGMNGDLCGLILSGGSDVEIVGKVRELKVNASGGSDVTAIDLESSIAVINLSGSSDGKFTVTDELHLNLSGGSDVECKGDPSVVKQVVCKSCDVRL